MGMSAGKRGFRVVALCALVSGCAGQRYAFSPGASAGPTPAGLADSVERGSQVRVVLLSDEVVEGKVSWVTDAEVAIRQVGEITARERVVEAKEIARIEVAAGPRPGQYVLAAVIGAGILYAIVEGVRNISFFSY